MRTQLPARSRRKVSQDPAGAEHSAESGAKRSALHEALDVRVRSFCCRRQSGVLQAAAKWSIKQADHPALPSVACCQDAAVLSCLDALGSSHEQGQPSHHCAKKSAHLADDVCLAHRSEEQHSCVLACSTPGVYICKGG